MQTETVKHGEGDWDIEVVVSEATVLMGARRTRMIVEAFEQEDEMDLDLRLLHRAVYPTCAAGTIEAKGIPWPLAFKDDDVEMDFVRLPDQFVWDWEAAARRLNPHWMLGSRKESEAEKKD